jgi:hypothetical protein
MPDGKTARSIKELKGLLARAAQAAAAPAAEPSAQAAAGPVPGGPQARQDNAATPPLIPPLPVAAGNGGLNALAQAANVAAGSPTHAARGGNLADDVSEPENTLGPAASASPVATQAVLRIPPTVFHLDPRLEGATDALLVLQVRGTTSNAMPPGQPACRRGGATLITGGLTPA